MRRPLLLGLLVGVANAVAAVVTLALIYALSPEVESFGYFGRAPFGADTAYESDVQFIFDSSGFPWEYVAVPAVLIVLNAVLLPIALRHKVVEVARDDADEAVSLRAWRAGGQRDAGMDSDRDAFPRA